MNTLHFGFENILSQSLFTSAFGLLALTGSFYLWLNRRPKLSARKVRVSRDITPYRRSSR